MLIVVLKLTSALMYIVVLLVSLVAIAASSYYCYCYYLKKNKVSKKFILFYTCIFRV